MALHLHGRGAVSGGSGPGGLHAALRSIHCAEEAILVHFRHGMHPVRHIPIGHSPRRFHDHYSVTRERKEPFPYYTFDYRGGLTRQPRSKGFGL